MYIHTKIKQGHAYTLDKNDETQKNGFWQHKFCGKNNSKFKQYVY